MKAEEQIEVYGARVHNLKNIDVNIPRNSLTVITGLSGSGKSSLAFDTIFAEGQRRYIETFTAYARNMLGGMERPDVDKITGLSPVISIEQKTTNKNPRSTVGTTTEIFDFFRLLFARAGEAYSYLSGEKMVRYTEEKIISLIMDLYQNKKTYILAPLVRNRKGHYKDLFEQVRRKGYLTVRIDGELREITHGMKLDRYKNHSIELVIDKLIVDKDDERRLQESVKTAMKQGDGQLMVLDAETQEIRHYSRTLMDPQTGLSYSEPAPHSFSFNSPQGACPKCKGLGYVNIIDKNKIIPNDEKSIYEGGIVPLGKYKNSLIFWQIAAICEKYDSSLKTPIKNLPEEALDDILNGTDERLQIKNESLGTSNYFLSFDGLIKYIEIQQQSDASSQAQKWAGQFVTTATCPLCEGHRLNKEALHYRIAGKNIADLADMDISELYEWVNHVEEYLSPQQRKIAAEILKEIRNRLHFLVDVGLDYLSLNRASATLSGGESQRIRLATQIGSQLVNVLYILDEPSIGLHQRDNTRLIQSLKELRDMGNSIIVVEHDKEMMLEADYIVDLGPRAGRLGGNIVFAGTPKEMLKTDTLTARYLTGKKEIEFAPQRRTGNGKKIILSGATGNNLKNVTVEFPLGKFICITGVSGSGKSSLINGTLQPIISQKFYRSLQNPLPYEKIEGLENIDKIVTVDQSPLGRTPRSNPATYTGVFADIRNVFVELPEAKIRGYKPGRFSFNIPGGRCEVCGGNGYKTIEMNFLPDVLVPCEACHGKRYNRETLEVRFKGKSIADVLDMTINQAVEFFENIPSIISKIKVLQDVGLGYIKLGQPSTTLSGGESQRVKLAAELSKRDTGKTLYILDEPTTGLHFEDIRVLLSVLNRLVDKGNTVIVIEHNLDIIKCADHIIDMGPEGGKNGGYVLTTGTPEEVCVQNTFTARYLKAELKV
ncbi:MULTISPECIES: excinuclease ABC subunit UvrA [Barnesiella]|jgi:excinuclease ABC subunit A|uniref:excinuclease ABC subunit UvrA n=1 Tax=Barnesiella TaxID=397864 RepID=UPI000E7E0B6B|nr:MULTISPECIES: excinuclease ABC subunit UvrA [Barnesiella]MBT9844923.1 excinuclease ABC subunit UvrA [Barnesiella intestinihominis]MDB0671168.1 excinuclease ABC subunit UvrA [Barnesiella intestinihominis]HBI66186.1 excinuclease ABC subunit UvrA [Barnesiella intestinihominis]HCP43863.1 excinuclease ABC subunit UvrA [Barnesiella intestinihominis]